MPYKDPEKQKEYMRNYAKQKRLEAKEGTYKNGSVTVNYKPVNHKPRNQKTFTDLEKENIKDIMIRALRNRTVHTNENDLIKKFIKKW